jgi:hypothetical protein
MVGNRSRKGNLTLDTVCSVVYKSLHGRLILRCGHRRTPLQGRSYATPETTRADHRTQAPRAVGVATPLHADGLPMEQPVISIWQYMSFSTVVECRAVTEGRTRRGSCHVK